jgi:hypothetical protein
MLKLAYGMLFATALLAPLNAGTVGWYNGNFDGVNGLANAWGGGTFADANVYEDFVVPSGGWTVTGLFSNNLMNFSAVTQAVWEIRSGVSVGNGGTLIAGGTSAATQTPTGRSGFGFTEYTIEVDGLNVFLAPGTYWMTVAPVASSGTAYNSTTSGAAAIGTPAGNNGNSFFNWPSNSVNFGAAADQMGGTPANPDFSNGVVIGAASAPEPSTLGLVFGAGLTLIGLRRRSR